MISCDYESSDVILTYILYIRTLPSKQNEFPSSGAPAETALLFAFAARKQEKTRFLGREYLSLPVLDVLAV